MLKPKRIPEFWRASAALVFAALAAVAAVAADISPPVTDNPSAPDGKADLGTDAVAHSQPQEQSWNWHVQNTDIVQYHPSFPAPYEGPNSLHHYHEAKETVSLDLYAGARLWRGAEFHLDGLMWQGFGLTRTLGIEGFPNGEAFRFGTTDPRVTFAHVFLRQTISLGGERESVSDDQLQLAGERDARRITLTVGKMSAKDVFDGNAYANDPRTQFMNWSLMANSAWDYAADSIGYITGLAAELNQPRWAARYGFFQVPRVSNGLALDPAYTRAWQMVTEIERRYTLGGHAGAIRALGYLTQSHMGSYQATLNDPTLGMDITRTRDYRHKYGFGLNVEQELTKHLGLFSRLGWSDGQNEAWAFSDVDRSASLGVSVKGALWNRPEDTLGIAGVLNGLSAVHSEFFAAGGTGILGGDGRLTYGLEEILETYYDLRLWKGLRVALDYQYVANPANNRDRGPVQVLGARLHWDF